MRIKEISHDSNGKIHIEHRHDTPKDACSKRDKANQFLDDFQTEEQVAASLHLQHVQVDGMERVKRTVQTNQREVGRSLMPLGANQTIKHRFRNGCKEKHARCSDKHRDLDNTPISRDHTLLVVLDIAEYGIGDALDDSGQVARKQRGELLGTSVLSQCSRRVNLAYDHLVRLFPHRIKHSAQHHLPPESEQIVKTFHREEQSG